MSTCPKCDGERMVMNNHGLGGVIEPCPACSAQYWRNDAETPGLIFQPRGGYIGTVRPISYDLEHKANRRWEVFFRSAMIGEGFALASFRGQRAVMACIDAHRARGEHG